MHLLEIKETSKNENILTDVNLCGSCTISTHLQKEQHCFANYTLSNYISH